VRCCCLAPVLLLGAARSCLAPSGPSRRAASTTTRGEQRAQHPKRGRRGGGWAMPSSQQQQGRQGGGSQLSNMYNSSSSSPGMPPNCQRRVSASATAYTWTPAMQQPSSVRRVWALQPVPPHRVVTSSQPCAGWHNCRSISYHWATQLGHALPHCGTYVRPITCATIHCPASSLDCQPLVPGQCFMSAEAAGCMSHSAACGSAMAMCQQPRQPRHSSSSSGTTQPPLQQHHINSQDV
jgi:hypothetical protein